MKIDILTLFPDMFEGFKNESIIKRALQNKIVDINTINFRDFAKNKHKKVDDTPYGGGAGMVLMCQPIFDAVKSVKKKNSKVIMLSPQGKKYTQEKAYQLSKEEHLILLCGHYEGFDERIKTIVDEEISIGDYVLTGGELPAMVLSDSIIRLLPGVIEKESHEVDSFNDNLLDYPTYTKPKTYKGLEVPEVLLSGDHKKIEEYRNKERIRVTKEKRPDLLNKSLKLKKDGIKKKKKIISTEDIKDIKVEEKQEIKEIKKEEKEPKKEEKIKISNKNKKYLIKHIEDIKSITKLSPKNIIGYRLKSKAKNGGKMVIVNHKFIEKIALKKIQNKINILAYRFNVALNSSEDETTGVVLGEAEMLKSMIVSMYARYLGADKIDLILKNIDLLIKEFVKLKTMQASYINKSEEIEARRR